MAIAMTTGYSAQTEGALLCIEAASDWALTCLYTHLTLPTICSV